MLRLQTILLILGLIGLPSATFAQDPPRLDPAIRKLMRPDVRAAIEQAPALGREMLRELRLPGGGLALDRAGPSASPRVGALIRLRTPGGLSLLRAVGAQIGTVIGGEIVTARVPLAALDRLSRALELEAIQAARRLEIIALAHDSSTVNIGATQVRQPEASGDWVGFAGDSVIVAVYDTGLDYVHDDFLDPAGKTRALGLWDQTASGAGAIPPSGYDYGHYCAPTSLDSGTCPQADTNGHGTHVAGSAAGDGSATGTGGTAYQYAGVAPEAKLLIVKGGNAGFAEDRVVDGINWIFERADALGMPAVVNLSLGSQYGPHDGTRLYEQAINELSGPGRIVVASAGNDGSNRNTASPAAPHYIHAMADLAVDATEVFGIQVPSYTPSDNPCEDIAAVDGWHEAGDELEIMVRRPDGSSFTVPHGTEDGDTTAGGAIYVWNAVDAPSPANGDFEVYVELSGCSASDAVSGTWEIHATPTVAGSGEPFHLWLYFSDFGPDSDPAFARGISDNFGNSYVVSSPAAADSAIAVAAYLTRLSWPSQEGTVEYTEPEALGDVARFSSGGPTRDGRLKPELSAPGMAIMSALSSTVDPSGQLVAPDGVHVINQGTSMSAPHVTGAIALLLDFRSNLGPGEVKDVFGASARQDDFTANSYTGIEPGPTTPNTQWGYGKLDVRQALQEIGAFGSASTLVVSADPLSPPSSPTSEAGTRIPLLELHFQADGEEAVDVTALAFDGVGEDPEARVVIAHDREADGAIGANDPILGSAEAALESDDTVRVRVEPDSLRVPPGGATTTVLVALEMSGAAPNGASFQMTYVPQETRSRGTESGVVNLIQQSVEPVASLGTNTTVLRPDEVFALSENPIRSDEVIFNFSERPKVAVVYTLSGRRVVDLLGRMTSDKRVVWDLTNDRGTPVAAGVYLAVFEVADELIREKLFIVRSAGGRE